MVGQNAYLDKENQSNFAIQRKEAREAIFGRAALVDRTNREEQSASETMGVGKLTEPVLLDQRALNDLVRIGDSALERLSEVGDAAGTGRKEKDHDYTTALRRVGTTAERALTQLRSASSSAKQTQKPASKQLLADMFMSGLFQLTRPYNTIYVPDHDTEASDSTECYWNHVRHAKDIFTYYHFRQYLFRVPRKYLLPHKDILPCDRMAAVDWLVYLQEQLEINHETIYLAVKLFDLYLSRIRPPCSQSAKAFPIMATALFIAAKFEERTYPTIDDLANCSPVSFDSAEILRYELEMLTDLSYDISFPVSYRFLRRFCRVRDDPMDYLVLARYYLECSLLSHTFSHYLDSKLAAGALLLAHINRRSFYTPDTLHESHIWPERMISATTYRIADLVEVALDLCDWLQNPIVPGADMDNELHIRAKYSHRTFLSVASLQLLNPEQLRQILQDLLRCPIPVFKSPRRDEADF